MISFPFKLNFFTMQTLKFKQYITVFLGFNQILCLRNLLFLIKLYNNALFKVIAMFINNMINNWQYCFECSFAYFAVLINDLCHLSDYRLKILILAMSAQGACLNLMVHFFIMLFLNLQYYNILYMQASSIWSNFLTIKKVFR